MKPFMDRDFLLSSDTARTLYHEHAANMPIIDYHCHVSPQEIAQDRRFDNITQVWLGGDHYKWRLMRTCGVDERYITGDASDKEKFLAFAATLPKCIGNPVYHWSHLELQRYFGYDKPLTSDTAEEVWELTRSVLTGGEMSVRSLITGSNVVLLCTTDDPCDTLEYHDMLAHERTFTTRVLPAWRPDKAMNLEKAGYADYIAKLSEVSGIAVTDFESLKSALHARLDFFDSMGCRVSDHAVEYVMYLPADDSEVDAIFKKALSGEKVTSEEELKFKTAFLLFCAREYSQRDWAMQLHYGCKRDNNGAMFAKLGPDTGFDCINNYTPCAQLADFLGRLATDDCLPRTILYSLNPIDNSAIDSIIGCFQGGSYGKIQHGSAWWFNDHLTGMRDQMTSLASLSSLGTFIGMLTDSRSFLSYTRHEYFRRILCELLGSWVESGQYPADMKTLGTIVEDISFNNAKNYFKF